MDITIEKLIYGGEGLAHHEGSTVFVPFVLPAERVTVAAVEQKKKFIRARVEKVVEPSAERVVAPCPHFGVCGGCDYQHIQYDAQLRFKADILRETLRRLGRVDWTGEIKAHASAPWGYRNRAQWKVRPVMDAGAAANAKSGSKSGSKSVPKSGSNAGSGGGTAGAATAGAPLAIGYFRANSTALCAVEECAILAPPLLKALLALRAAAAASELPKTLREIEAFAARGAEGSAPKLLVTATFAGFPARAQETAERIREIVPGLESLLFHDPSHERMELDGPGFVEYAAAGHTYRVGHFSFFQVNDFLVEELAQQAAAEEPGRLALDLFAGVGLFSVPLAKQFQRVIAVEANPAAVRDLEINVGGQGAIEVRASDVERFLDKCKEKPELVFLDPPRAGLEPGAVSRLVRMAPQRITYVSCEPPTLARDLAALVQGGYEIAEVSLYDLFPQTFHMEAIVRLRRRQ
jgi:23S rRNA (uracil1939-C5)-methyltransferase